ncbi:MAG: hypothetical protein LBO09_09470 [Candidatus Peribacteria bacterium]|nr:hypothetical protein [Candidatus Peribacteria bacterium]
MAKRRRAKSRTILNLNKYHVGILCIVLGAIFFFSKIVAPDAPIFKFLSENASIAFGQLGLLVFFALCIVLGILILFKGYLMKTFIKQFILLMFVVSGILNFQAMNEDVGSSLVNRVKSAEYGGYFSWPLIKGLELLFGQSLWAIRILVILFALLILLWIFYVLNVKLPSLPKVSLHQEEKPVPRNEETKKPFITREAKITSDSELLRKVSQATGVSSAKNEQASGSLLKDMLRQKLESKMSSATTGGKGAHKEEPKPRRQIQFSGDKPTFPYSLLENTL